MDYNKCVFFFTLADINMMKLDKNFSNIPRVLRMSSVLFFARLVFYHVLIASSQKYPKLNIITLFMIELVVLTLYLSILTKYAKICNKITLISKVFQTVSLMVFLSVCFKLSDRHPEDDSPVNSRIQQVGIYTLTASLVFEYLFVASQVFNLIIKLIWKKWYKITLFVRIKQHIIYKTLFDQIDERRIALELEALLRKRALER